MKISIRLGLDVDGVICNFAQAAIERGRARGGEYPCCWRHVNKWDISEHFKQTFKEGFNDADFWRSLKPMPGARACLAALSVTPELYLTARRVGVEVTRHWLFTNDFPRASVASVLDPKDKLEVLQDFNITHFVDDYPPTVEHLRENGINAVLFAAPHQCERDVSHLPVIHSLDEMEAYLNGE